VGAGGNKLAASHRVDNFSKWRLKYELKKIVICPRHRRNSPVCVTKVGHVNTLSIKEKKEIEETEEDYR